MITLLNRLRKSTTVIIALILLVQSGCKNHVPENVLKEISETGTKFVPDHRLGVWNISPKVSGKYNIILKGETTSSEGKAELIKTLSSQGITLIDSIIILPDSINNKLRWGLVTLSVVNLRKFPAHSSELVSQAILGTPVLVLKDGGSWLLIQTPDNYISWTEKSSLALVSQPELNDWKHSERVIYTENTGWIYERPGSDGIVGDIVAGAIVVKEGDTAGYIKIKLPDGRVGYVKKNKTLNFDTFRHSSLTSEDSVISVASTLIGIPYLWGGASPKGVDCSGFAQSVFFRSGLILQRDASLQALHGTNIDISDGYGKLHKGDLLFFGSKENNKMHVTHVAIYIGNNEYINSSGLVMINSLDSTSSLFSIHRKNSLLAAHRVLGIADDPGILPVIQHPWY